MTSRSFQSEEMGCSNALTAESQFIADGREQIVAKFQSMYWPNKARVGVRSLGGFIYQRKNVSMMRDFVEDQNEEIVEVAKAGLVWNSDPSLCIKRDIVVAIVQLGQAEVDVEGEEEEENEEEKGSVILF